MGFLTGKRALIVGVATDRSIAWGIAQAMHREGATLALSYANDKFKERVVPLAQGLDALTLPLDVSRDEEISAAFDFIRREWGSLDTIIMEDASQAVSSSEPGIYDIRSKSDKTSPLDGTRYSDW